MKYSKEQIAAMFGCTVERLEKQYSDNARELSDMATKAYESKSGKYRGATKEYLADKALQYEVLAGENEGCM